MKNKTLIIILGSLGLLAVVLTIFSYTKKSSPASPIATPTPSTTTALGSLNSFSGPIISNSTEAVPNPATRLGELESLGVNPANIYPNNPPVEARADSTIVSNDSFSLVYLALPNQFQITLYQEPFAETQTLAEQELLTALKISQEVACKLPVIIVKDWADPEKANEISRKLSFCP